MTSLFFILFSLTAMATTPKELAENPQFQWQKTTTGSAGSSFPVTGVIIADEGALHIQSARISGRVLSLKNEEGDSITKGEPILSVFGPECVSIREEKRIALKSGLQDLVSSITLREKELNLKVGEQNCLVLSDASGVMVKRGIGSGNSFNQGDVLAQILEPNKLRVELEIPETSASSIASGTNVTFRMPSVPGFKGTTTIQQVFPIVEEGTRMMRARLHKMDFPKGTKLNSMVFADIEIAKDKQAMSAPASAITFQDNNSWILKKSPELKAVKVRILGNSSGQVIFTPVKADELSDTDLIATKDVPFLYQALKRGDR